MSDAEVRALRRAVVALLVLSFARWGSTRAPTALPESSGNPLPALIESSASALEEAERRSMPLSAGERLDPNRAPAEELDRLPGIGVVTAEAIIRTRESGGPFAHIQDLERVPGIGPAMLRRLAPTLDLDDPPVSRRPSSGSTPERVELNRATEEELTALPGIGPALAARIVAARVEAPFTSVEDLVRVRGIGPATVERLRPLARVGLGR